MSIIDIQQVYNPIYQIYLQIGDKYKSRLANNQLVDSQEEAKVAATTFCSDQPIEDCLGFLDFIDYYYPQPEIRSKYVDLIEIADSLTLHRAAALSLLKEMKEYCLTDQAEVLPTIKKTLQEVVKVTGWATETAFKLLEVLIVKGHIYDLNSFNQANKLIISMAESAGDNKSDAYASLINLVHGQYFGDIGFDNLINISRWGGGNSSKILDALSFLAENQFIATEGIDATIKVLNDIQGFAGDEETGWNAFKQLINTSQAFVEAMSYGRLSLLAKYTKESFGSAVYFLNRLFEIGAVRKPSDFAKILTVAKRVGASTPDYLLKILNKQQK